MRPKIAQQLTEGNRLPGWLHQALESAGRIQKACQWPPSLLLAHYPYNAEGYTTAEASPKRERATGRAGTKSTNASLEQLQVQWEQVGARRCHPQYLCQCWKLHGKEQDEINAAGSITERRVQPLTCSAHFLRSGKLAGQVQFQGSPACGH